MEKGYDKNNDSIVEKDAYIEDLMSAATQSKVSPCVLAATIIVEQGVNGAGDLISGKYSGYEGYYNFFNFNAAGSTTQAIVSNGLLFAKESGWNSRSAAIIGGAKKYADGYISIGQDTYYYKDFNVIKESWSHQYASALYDAWTNASYLKKGCTVSTDSTLTFSIPVFADMPQVVCPNPSYMINTQVRDDCIALTTLKSGIYTIDTGEREIIVTDKSGNTVKYNQQNSGYPLVANQTYTVTVKNYDGDYDALTWNIKKISNAVFTDTSADQWYNDPITYVSGAGLMTGYGGTDKFGVADKIQRQDFVVILARMAGVDLSQYDNAENRFTDVPNGEYYTNAILWAVDAGITTGYAHTGGTVFGVGDPITREQLVTFLYRYAKHANGGDAPTISDNAATTAAAYPDFAAVNDFAKDAVIWALDKGVIKGQGGTHIAPANNSLRCEVAQIIYNISSKNLI